MINEFENRTTNDTEVAAGLLIDKVLQLIEPVEALEPIVQWSKESNNLFFQEKYNGYMRWKLYILDIVEWIFYWADVILEWH